MATNVAANVATLGLAGQSATVANGKQYFTDFSEYTTGVQPSDWTRRWVTTNWATTVVADAAASGGKVFQLNPSGVNARRLITWDLIDVDANRDAVEVYVKFKAVSTSDNLRECHALLRGSGSAASETGYRLGAAAATGTPFAVAKYVSGAFTSISSTNVTRADSEIWHMRGRANGTALKLRWWKDGDSEPVAWSDEQTDSGISAISAAGWVGLFLFHGNAAAYVDVDIFSVGTGGVAAPTAALTSPTAISANTATLATTTETASVNAATSVATNVATLTTAGQTAGINAATGIAPAAVALSLAGQAAGIARDTNVQAQAGSLTLTPLEAFAGSGLNVGAGVATLALTVQAATIAADRVIAANTVAVSLAGLSATVATGINTNIAANTASVALTGLNAAVVAGISDQRAVLWATTENGTYTALGYDSWSDTSVTFTPDETVPVNAVWFRIRTRDGTLSSPFQAAWIDYRAVLWSTTQYGTYTAIPFDAWNDTSVTFTPSGLPAGDIWIKVRTRDGLLSNAFLAQMAAQQAGHARFGFGQYRSELTFARYRIEAQFADSQSVLALRG